MTSSASFRPAALSSWSAPSLPNSGTCESMRTAPVQLTWCAPRFVVVAGAVVITFVVTRDDSGDSAQSDGRSASAIAEVTSLEGMSATSEEQAFVDDLTSGMSRPYWDNGPEVMSSATRSARPAHLGRRLRP
jgi:hypothetical protein